MTSQNVSNIATTCLLLMIQRSSLLQKIVIYYFKKEIKNSKTLTIAVPAGGAGGAIAPPSFEDLGKIKIFQAVRRKYLGKTIVFRAAI